MTDHIKPGAMGGASEAGMPTEFADSMAAAIEAAFNSILAAEGKQTFDPNDNSRQARDRRMLFVAIAQGVVGHLAAHQAALEIYSGSTLQPETIEIQTE